MYIVTGGAGFIGSAFVHRLNQAGIDNIWIVDSLGHSLKWKNLLALRFEEYFHKEDFLKKVLEKSLPTKMDAIIHMGACSSTTETNADYFMQNNYYYSRILAEWAVQHKIRFIYASSAATYGDGSLGFADNLEISHNLKPLNIYGYSKQIFDLWLMHKQWMDQVVGLKFFNVFGPNEYHKGDMRSVAHKAYQQVKEKGKVQLFKSYRPDYIDGEQCRDFLYIKECVEMMWLVLNNDRINGLLNIGTGQARTWNDLMKAVFKAMGKRSHIDYVDMPESIRHQYQYHTQADMQKAAQLGCYRTQWTLEKAVEDYVVNYLEKSDPYLGGESA